MPIPVRDEETGSDDSCPTPPPPDKECELREDPRSAALAKLPDAAGAADALAALDVPGAEEEVIDGFALPARHPKNLDYDEDCHCCLRVGASWLICGKKRSRWPAQWFVGPDWCCMLVTYTLIAVPTFAFVYWVGKWHPAVRGLAALTGLLTLGFYTTTACSDPGIAWRRLGSGDPPGRLCSRCDFERPLDARHCYDCDLCVTDLDHHCPWTGKCIGGRTIRTFNAFLICLSVHALIVVVGTLAWLANDRRR